VKRAEKAARIRRILDDLYPEVKIPLDHRDPYTLLIAVLLSAQCTDVKVNQITPLLFARAATPQAMVKVPVAEIRRIIRPCGLSPAKAKAIAGLSKLLLERHGGRVPDDLEALEALPGVGHKTASAVLAQAFGRPAFPVDTHIHRLAARWGLSSGRSVEQTERDLKQLFPPESWGRLHLQLIYFGRQRCPARGHDLSACPICSWAASKARQARERKRAKRARSEPEASEVHRRPKASPRPKTRHSSR
jgi:endonuclease-3